MNLALRLAIPILLNLLREQGPILLEKALLRLQQLLEQKETGALPADGVSAADLPDDVNKVIDDVVAAA